MAAVGNPSCAFASSASCRQKLPSGRTSAPASPDCGPRSSPCPRRPCGLCGGDRAGRSYRVRAVLRTRHSGRRPWRRSRSPAPARRPRPAPDRARIPPPPAPCPIRWASSVPRTVRRRSKSSPERACRSVLPWRNRISRFMQLRPSRPGPYIRLLGLGCRNSATAIPPAPRPTPCVATPPLPASWRTRRVGAAASSITNTPLSSARRIRRPNAWAMRALAMASS